MDPAIFWTATALSLVGNTAFTLSALFSNKRISVAMQTSNHLLSSVAQFLQNAFSGMVQDVVCFFKNIILLLVPDSKKSVRTVISIICIALGISLGIALNVILSGNVWYGYLPVFSSAILSTTILLCYTFEFKPFKQLLILKGGLMINAVAWLIYGLYIKLYPVTAFNCITFVLAIVAIVRFIVTEKKRGRETEEQVEEQKE